MMSDTMFGGYTSSEESENGENGANLGKSRGRRPACRNKNALLARENRLKKKAYVNELENRVKTLKRESKKLKTVLGTQASYIDELVSEIKYLKATLVNASDIGVLVSKLRGPVHSVDSRAFSKNMFQNPISPIVTPTADLLRPFSPLDIDLIEKESPLFAYDDSFSRSVEERVAAPVRPLPGKRMPSSDSFSDHNYSAFYDSDERLPKSLGVCLHVSDNNMSLEFCAKCNESAIRNRNLVDN